MITVWSSGSNPRLEEKYSCHDAVTPDSKDDDIDEDDENALLWFLADDDDDDTWIL